MAQHRDRITELIEEIVYLKSLRTDKGLRIQLNELLAENKRLRHSIKINEQTIKRLTGEKKDFSKKLSDLLMDFHCDWLNLNHSDSKVDLYAAARKALNLKKTTRPSDIEKRKIYNWIASQPKEDLIKINVASLNSTAKNESQYRASVKVIKPQPILPERGKTMLVSTQTNWVIVDDSSLPLATRIKALKTDKLKLGGANRVTALSQAAKKAVGINNTKGPSTTINNEHVINWLVAHTEEQLIKIVADDRDIRMSKKNFIFLQKI